MRFNERSFVVLVAGVLVIAIAGVLAWTLLLEEDEPAEEAAAVNAASTFAGGPDEVLLLSGTTLVRRDVEKQSEDLLAKVPTPSVYAAPGSPWLAYVSSAASSADGDFAAEPVLELYNVETKEKHEYGPGVVPVWNAAGTHLAFLKPVEPRDCLGEDCPGAVQIVVLEAETGDETFLQTPGRYSILGWAGDHVLISNFDNPTEVLSISLDDELTILDMPVSQFWGASPDGRWLIKANARKTEFISMEDGTFTEERVTVELGDQKLLEGAWSHDSSTVAAITTVTSSVPKGKGKDEDLVPGGATTQVVTFSPEDPKPQIVEGTFGATSTLLWSPDNDAIVFASLLDPRKALFQARHCTLGNSEGCSIVTSWTEGTVLLRAE